MHKMWLPITVRKWFSETIIIIITVNRKHRRAAAKPAAYAKPLMLSTAGREGQRYRMAALPTYRWRPLFNAAKFG